MSDDSIKVTDSSSKRRACFVFPEASGHINASLALTSHLTQNRGWEVHYLSAKVMEGCILDAGATFHDEREAALELCDGGLGYFAAYERLRKERCPPGAKTWECRAHAENLFCLQKMDGTIQWLRDKNPSVVVYCPFWNRVAQLASLVVGVPHVAICTIAGFGGFHSILKNFLDGEKASFEEFTDLYQTSEINQTAIDAFCRPPYNLKRSLFESGSPVYYWGTDPPFGQTLGPSENLVTTIASLRDPILDMSIEDEAEFYRTKCQTKLCYIGPMLGVPGMKRAATHKAAFTLEEQQLLIEQSEIKHRRRSDLHPRKSEDLVALAKSAKDQGRPLILVCMGTVVTSDRAGFGWKGTGLGTSITGKELVQSVVNGVLDAVGLSRLSPQRSIVIDSSSYPLVLCAVGQQPDALDSIELPPNAVCRASVPQVDLLRCMDSKDLFIQHGGQNSTMEGLSVGVPMVVCPTFGDQPVNAKKLVDLGVGLAVNRPTQGGPQAVSDYRKAVATAVCAIQADQDSFATAATRMKDEIAASGGEVEAEAVLIRAIERGM